MPIYIAKEFNGEVESIVLAKSIELANAYWQGKNIYAHSIDIKEEADLDDHPTGVLPIVSTVKKEFYVNGKHRKYRLIPKT